MQLSPIIQVVLDQHPDLSHEELTEIAEDYLAQFSTKTKEATKEKSLKKYFSKLFEVSYEMQTAEKNQTFSPFSSLPKSYFSYTSAKKSDYILRIKELSKELGATRLFDQASLNIQPQDKIALIGKNGAGKSTLLKLILNPELIDSGEIITLKETKIGFLSQDLFRESRERSVEEEMFSTFPEITKNTRRLAVIKELLEQGSEESIALLDEQSDLIDRMIQHDGYQKYDLQKDILKYFGFSQDQLSFPISQLSGGEQTKVQIAKFFLQDVDILILDEPTNHLDIEGIMFLEYFCSMWNKALICISHDKKFLNTVFGKVVEIENLKLNLYQGNYDSMLEQKEKAFDIQLKHYTAQQKYLKQQEKFIVRFRAKASKASAVQSRIKMLDKLQKVDAPTQSAGAHRLHLAVDKKLPGTLIKMEQLSVGYPDNLLLTLPRELKVEKKQKIGIIGKNGVGKTTLLNTLLGTLSPLSGTIELNEKVKIGYYSQIAENLDYEASIEQELIAFGVSYKQVMTILGSLAIAPEKISQKIGTLSGGERAKVALTKMLLDQPEMIIMDEPTNHLDIASKEVIKSLLADFEGVSIIVSHDRDFLESSSNLLRVINNGVLTVTEDLDEGFRSLLDEKYI